MPGLLDFVATPEGQGLLSAAFGGLASARRGAPLNAIGAAGLSGLAGYTNQTERLQNDAREKQLSQMRAAQLKQIQQKLQDDEDVRNLAGQYYKGGMPTEQLFSAPGQVGPTNERAALQGASGPTFDSNGFVGALFGKNPMLGLQYQQALAKELPFNKIDPKDFTPESVAKFAQSRNYGDLMPRSKKELAPNGQVYDPYAVQSGTVLADPNKPFSVGADGKFVPNTSYQEYEIGKARAGAANTNVKIENKTGESLAAQVGPIAKESFTAANGAIQTADAANRVIQAVQGGKLYAGPGANTRLTMAQIGETLGVTGKDTIEKIANTRQALTGLSQMTLQGRKQMSGQGAITESESKLAERAMSGDINFTPGELMQLAKAAQRSAKFTYDQHQAQIKNMQQDPNLQGLSRFYSTPAFPSGFPDAPAAKSGGVQFLGFE